MCASFDLKLFVQSGLTVGYLVTHFILDVRSVRIQDEANTTETEIQFKANYLVPISHWFEAKLLRLSWNTPIWKWYSIATKEINNFSLLFYMFQICILVTIDVMHPYIVGYDDGRRFSTRLFYKAIAELYILLSHFFVFINLYNFYFISIVRWFCYLPGKPRHTYDVSTSHYSLYLWYFWST